MISYAVTDTGKRQVNQDYVYCSNEQNGILPNLYIVADGMGGHNAGDFASRFAVEEFVRQIKTGSGKTIVHSIEEAVTKTNHQLLQQSEKSSELAGMGTTFVVATIAENELYVANIGDSRLYYIHEGKMKQITMDHSLVDEMVRRGEVKREEARFHPNKNVITRAMGANSEVTPDCFEVGVTAGDIILLCSDGLSNMVDDSEIASVINDHCDDLEVAGSTLLNLANEYGGKDNISIILVQVE